MNEEKRRLPTYMSTVMMNPFLKAVLVLVVLLLLPAIDTLSESYPFTHGIVIGICTAIALALSVWWYSRIRWVFANGAYLDATLYSVYKMYRNDRQQVKFTYYYNDERYEKSHRVPMDDDTQEMKEGSEICVVVHPEHPERCWIRDLYI